MNNHEKYFGDPEKVAQVFTDLDAWNTDGTKHGFIADMMDGWAEYGLAHHDTLLMWLQEECND